VHPCEVPSRLIFDPLPLAVLGLLLAVAAIMLARTISVRTRLVAAGPVALICLTPLIPPQSIALGIGIDDVLPLTGLALLVLTPGAISGLRSVAAGARPTLLAAGAGLALLIVAGAVSGVANGRDVTDMAALFLKSAGRYAFVGAIAALVAVSVGRGLLTPRAALAVPALAGAVLAAVSLLIFLTPLRSMIGVQAGGGLDIFGFVLQGRLAGPPGVANFTAAVVMLATIAAAGLALLSTGRTRLLYLAIVLLDLIVIALSDTRSSFVLTGLALAVLIVLAGRPWLLVPLGAAAALFVAATPLLNRLLSGTTDRLALWTSAVLMTLDHPITGVGAGRMVTVLQQNPERYVETSFGRATASAHNIVLLAGAELGLLGLVGVAVIVVALGLGSLRALWTMVRRGRVGWLGATSALAVLAFLAQCMTNNLVTVGSTGVIAAVLVGAMLSELSLTSSVETSPEPLAGERVVASASSRPAHADD
jgi:O-antigen ligase